MRADQPRSGCLKMGTHFLHVGLERIWHGKGRLATQLEDRPVDHIRRRKPFFRLGISWFIRRSTGQQMSNKFTPSKRPGVAWWMVHGQRQSPCPW